MTRPAERMEAALDHRDYRQKWRATITQELDCFGEPYHDGPMIYAWVCYTHALPEVSEAHALRNARSSWVYGRKWPDKIRLEPCFDDPTACLLAREEHVDCLAAVRSTYGMTGEAA